MGIVRASDDSCNNAVHVRRGYNKATIAVANKLGRLVWAVWHKDVPCALPDAA